MPQCDRVFTCSSQNSLWNSTSKIWYYDNSKFYDIPKFKRLFITLLESLQVKVLKTWFLNASFIPSSTVSLSLIFPTIMIFGNFRKIYLIIEENDSQISPFTWIWFMSSILFNIGSSIVMFFLAGEEISLRIVYNVVFTSTCM